MNRAVKQYLRQVKKQLCCPRSLSRQFLRQLEDEVLLYCENENLGFEDIQTRFGNPEDIATDFYTQSDPEAVSRFAYARLRISYGLLALVVLIAAVFITVNAVKNRKTQQLIDMPHTADTFVHPDGRVCDEFTVRTNFRGKDVYWEYHSCMGGLMLTIPPKDPDSNEPYATDIYIKDDGIIEHWRYSDDNFYWIRVYDD